MTRAHPDRLPWASKPADRKWWIGRSDLGDYMHRWEFRTPWFAIRLHHILRNDQAEDLHDHPWDFTSFLLTGPYVEVVLEDSIRGVFAGQTRRVRHERFAVVRHRAEDLHRIELPEGPVWTLVLTGPLRRSWGFLTSAGWLPWAEAKAFWERTARAYDWRKSPPARPVPTQAEKTEKVFGADRIYLGSLLDEIEDYPSAEAIAAARDVFGDRMAAAVELPVFLIRRDHYTRDEEQRRRFEPEPELEDIPREPTEEAPLPACRFGQLDEHERTVFGGPLRGAVPRPCANATYGCRGVVDRDGLCPDCLPKGAA
jgi:hypothetical protein